MCTSRSFVSWCAVPLVLLVMAAGAAAQPAPIAAKPTLDRGVVDHAKLAGIAALEDVAVEDRGGRVVLTRVDAGGPWHALGVRAGDVVVALNGAVPASSGDLRLAAIDTRRAAVVYVEILRGKRAIVLRRVIQGAPAAAASDLPAAPPTADPDLAAELDRLVAHKGGTTWEVDADALLADPARFARGARVMPSVKNGQPNGFKLYAVRPTSLYARLGLQNGDTIVRVGGHDLGTPEQALDAYTRVRNADRVEVEIIRRGKPVTHTYLRRKAPATVERP